MSSLQCNAGRPTHPHPLFRVIEYRSLALPQCVSECVSGRVCLPETLQGHCHGNLSTGSSRCAVTVHRSEGSRERKKGDCRGDKRGLASAVVLGLVEVRGPTRVGAVSLCCVFKAAPNNEKCLHPVQFSFKHLQSTANMALSKNRPRHCLYSNCLLHRLWHLNTKNTQITPKTIKCT